MTSAVALAAWYPDPSDPTKLRWWDGFQWTHDTRPVGGQPAVGGPSAVGGQSPVGLGRLTLRGAGSKGTNQYSLITFGVGALYLIVAFFTHFVLVGFIPLAMAIRAKRAGEALAPLAIAAAVGVILISLLTLFH